MDKTWVLTVTYRDRSWVLATAKCRKDVEKYRSICSMALGFGFSVVAHKVCVEDLVLYKFSDRLNDVLENTYGASHFSYSNELAIRRIVYEVFDLHGELLGRVLRSENV